MISMTFDVTAGDLGILPRRMSTPARPNRIRAGYENQEVRVKMVRNSRKEIRRL